MKYQFECAVLVLTLGTVAFAVSGAIRAGAEQTATTVDPAIDKHTQGALIEGRQILRFDTFGDEAFWGDTIKVHQAIEGTRFGGVGPGVSPKTALAVGLKGDVDALPRDLSASLKQGQVDLE